MDQTDSGPIETWYSREGEVLRLQHGRIKTAAWVLPFDEAHPQLVQRLNFEALKIFHGISLLRRTLEELHFRQNKTLSD
jgi:hypothetical protein